MKLFPYVLTCLSFTMIIGAGIYEHIAVWPRVYAAPPKSLSMFQGAYGLNAGTFWRAIHPITVLLLMITLIAWWKSPAKNYILVPFGMYILMLAATFAYFVPELINITGTPYADTIDDSLKSRGSLWITLSWIRAIIISAAAVILYSGLTKVDSTIAVQ